MNLEFVNTRFRLRRSLIAHPDTCAGCRACEVICATYHEGSIDLVKARISVDRDPFEGSFIPRVCHQCSDPYCMTACPNGAIGVRDEDGVIVVNQEKCVCCGKCTQACPFHVMKIDKDKKKAIKCDLCGGHPKCVRWCPMNALGIAKYGEEKL